MCTYRQCVVAWYRGMAAKQSYFPMEKKYSENKQILPQEPSYRSGRACWKLIKMLILTRWMGWWMTISLRKQHVFSRTVLAELPCIRGRHRYSEKNNHFTLPYDAGGTYYFMMGDVRTTPANLGNVDAKMDRMLCVSCLSGIIHAVIDSAIVDIFSR